VRTEVAFSAANEQIAQKREELEVAVTPPVICECGDEGCTVLLRVDGDTYERVRADGRRFVVAPGHEPEYAEIVERADGYSVIEKHGEHGELAAQLGGRG